jgi:hypothetical protein
VFDDRGLVDSNVIHGPVAIRGPITLDAAAAISLFRELYSDRSDDGSDGRNGSVGQRGLAEWWERVSDFFRPEHDTCKKSEWEIQESILSKGLEWNPLSQEGLIFPTDTPVVDEVPIAWQVVDDFAPTKNGDPPAQVIFRGRVSFASPDPVGTRMLYLRTGAEKRVLAVKAAQPSRGGTMPDFLDFEAVLPGECLSENPPVEFFLARKPAGKLLAVKTNTRMMRLTHRP